MNYTTRFIEISSLQLVFSTRDCQLFLLFTNYIFFEYTVFDEPLSNQQIKYTQFKLRRSFHTLETVIAFDSIKFKVTELPPNHLQMELTPAEKLLKEVNLSLTRQRVAVLELFLKEEHPMTPHEVREILEDQEHVDQVTIYRVLEALVRTRLLTQVPSTDRNSYYCLAERLQGLHAHLYCNLCRRMLCVESPLAAQTERGEELHVVLSGTCTQCDQAVPDTNI